jgi:hypothetical protein
LEHSDYIALLNETAKLKKLSLEDGIVDTLMGLHSESGKAFYPCLPKDLLGISRDILLFEGGGSEVHADILRRAWELYFTVDE